MPARHRAVWVPEELSIVMSVKIDETGSYIQPAGVNCFFGFVGLQIADFGDLAFPDADICPVTRHPRPVDYRAASNNKVKLRHLCPPCESLIDQSEGEVFKTDWSPGAYKPVCPNLTLPERVLQNLNFDKYSN
jgi:hypothetical protein